ncbi:MAG: 6-phosphofructokinase, partial [Anaerolineae bacterium]|nr:6-phosphofructokinase [Anaerolineae bacterium]
GARATAYALPGRIFMIETLGGSSGMLALEVAKGAGADAILVPEYAYNEDWLADRLNTRIAANGNALIIVCEGLPNKATLADKIPEWTGIRLRDVRLGHAQRGGTTTHRDRAFAADLALKAHEALHAGCKLGTIIVRDGVTRLFEGKLTGATPLPDPITYTQINGSQSWHGHFSN